MSSSREQVIELSIDETNKLRAELGLPPLRVNPSRTPSSNQPHDEPKIRELSVNDTNELRLKLGLPLLKESKTKVLHAPPPTADTAAAAERLERARLARQVQQGILQIAQPKTLGEDITYSAREWALDIMKRQKQEEESTITQVNEQPASEYDEKALHGITVGHSMNEIEEGETTVLTLADASLLKTQDDTVLGKVVGLNEEDVVLENVDLAQARKQRDGLKEKRKMELGMGRAGGYAGFDDDEFEELGGALGPSRFARGKGMPLDDSAKTKPRGFQIGSMLDERDKDLESDLFAAQAGKAISLESLRVDVVASDFMTVDEEEAERKKRKEKEKFKKKKKKEKKSRKSIIDEEEEPDSVNRPKVSKKSLIEELEETAKEETAQLKRRRLEDTVAADFEDDKDAPMDVDIVDVSWQEKRAKYEAAMTKGNERTNEVFGLKKVVDFVDIEEEPDDAFLNAALAKARRLNRLKQIPESSAKMRGADAVLEAIQSSQLAMPGEVKSGGMVQFAVDETQEFTRALRAKAEQSDRGRIKITMKRSAASEVIPAVEMTVQTGATNVKVEDADEDVDMNELAKEVKVDDDAKAALDGTTGSTAALGRGIGGVLSLLKQTGELARKNAGKEEMRGRAKDKRFYEDYQPLDLNEVVKIDESTATDKDKELASREVKLEYRDKYGRLLTRKEAFRDLSYQFHGYGSGKRKDEKRKHQVAREQAEAQLASRQVTEGTGTLGALKATQKATGKAFVVHKT